MCKKSIYNASVVCYIVTIENNPPPRVKGRKENTMKQNEYAAILVALRAAKEVMQELACPGYPHEVMPDAFYDMFYGINDMCIRLRAMMEEDSEQ